MNREKVDMIFRDNFMLDQNEDLIEKNMWNVDAWHSMEHFSLVVELEEAFSIRIEQEDILRMTSYKGILQVLEEYSVI